jgi:hypothetical protein
MQTYHIESIVSADRVLTIRGVPFRSGERVQVIVVRLSNQSKGANRYPLRGKPYLYTAPFDSVAENDWDALK